MAHKSGAGVSLFRKRSYGGRGAAAAAPRPARRPADSWELQPLIARLGRRSGQEGHSDMWSFVPGLEIASMRHARLDARLFRS